jgi:hypothetical protein
VLSHHNPFSAVFTTNIAESNFGTHRVGAWIGSPVFGHWPRGILYLQYEEIYVIPAILGAAAIIIVAVDLGHMAFGAPKTPARRTRR